MTGRLAVALGLFALASHSALAAYPDRPIKLIVPWAAGGDTDSIYRSLGPHLQKHLGGTVVIANVGAPSGDVLARYAAEHKEPLRVGDLPPETELITGEFWRSGIARHDRRRLSYAAWAVLSRRLLH